MVLARSNTLSFRMNMSHVRHLAFFFQSMSLKNRVFNHDSFFCACFVCFSSFVTTVKVMVSIKLAYGSGTALASLSRKVML